VPGENKPLAGELCSRGEGDSASCVATPPGFNEATRMSGGPSRGSMSERFSEPVREIRLADCGEWALETWPPPAAITGSIQPDGRTVRCELEHARRRVRAIFARTASASARHAALGA